jgi:transposase
VIHGLACNDRRTWVAIRPVAWIGIDAGKAAHHAAAVDDQGTVCWSQRVPNDQAAIEQLAARAARTADEVRWAVDLTSSAAALLLAVLAATGQKVVYVPGSTVSRMAGVFRGEGKTDAKDARVIAETARMRRDLTEITTPDELVVELTRLTAHRTDLMADWVRGVNRLRDLLTSVFPALERAFDYSTRSALILVSGFQSPDAVREAGQAGLTRFLLEHGARGVPAMTGKALAAAAAQTLRLPGEATTAVLVAGLSRQLLDLDRQIKDTTRLITERFRTHPQAAIIESLPGLGPLLGAEFVVATRGDLATFATPGRLASYAGLVPVPQDSGRICGNLHRPKRYNRRLRRVFYMAALSSIKADGPSRTFYQRKREERLIHTQALLALARRLVDVLWALLRDNRTFTPVPPQIIAQAA